MARHVTGPAHLRAHRYARRRLDWALTLGTALPPADPTRTARRSTVGSYALAAGLLATVGVLAIARPAPDWSAAGVLVVEGSGAVFVNRAGVLHPALNLTSALLALPESSDTEPLAVSPADISAAPRGATVGIVGAPSTLPSRDGLITSGWALCDAAGGTGDVVTTAVIGPAAPGAALAPDEAVFVTGENEPPGSTRASLLWAGRQIPVDRADRPLVQALGLSGTIPRPASAALLSALPDVPPPDVRTPIGVGEPGAVDIRDGDGIPVAVGSVLRVPRADGTVSLELVHRDGVESVSPVLADLVLARWGGRLVPVAPWQSALLAGTAEPLAVGTTLPPSAPRLVTSGTPLLCARWQSDIAGWTVSSAMSLDPTVPVLGASSAGGRLDQVQIEPGTGAVVRAADAGGPDDTTYLVSDLGIAFPVTDEVPHLLGLLDPGAAPPTAPSAILDVLPRGPELTAERARRAWVYDDAGAASLRTVTPSP